jgi:hypothetical protein
MGSQVVGSTARSNGKRLNGRASSMSISRRRLKHGVRSEPRGGLASPRGSIFELGRYIGRFPLSSMRLGPSSDPTKLYATLSRTYEN